MRQDLDRLSNLIAAATAAIAPAYFLLPVADRDGGGRLIEYRERVYAYELYHQLRRTAEQILIVQEFLAKQGKKRSA